MHMCMYICIFIYLSQESYSAGANVAPIRNNLLKVIYNEVEDQHSNTGLSPFTSCALGRGADSWTTIKGGEIDSCLCCVASRDNGKILSESNIFKLPLPTQICSL